MDWFLYDRNLRHERVNCQLWTDLFSNFLLKVNNNFNEVKWGDFNDFNGEVSTMFNDSSNFIK